MAVPAMQPRVRPDAARPRATTSALFGALVVAVGWTVWSTLGPTAPSESALPLGTPVTEAAAPPAAVPTPVQRATVQAASLDATNVAVTAKPSATPAPPLRDGLVMEHGMPTAVRALVADAEVEVAAQPPAAGLPAGVRPQDASVNRAGMVTLKRSADAPAGSDVSTANASRVATLTRAP